MPISRFCHRDPTCGVVSPGAVSRFGFARPASRLEPEFVRARRRRSISATTMRYVGTPLRVLRFLARGAGMNQFTLAAQANGYPSGPYNCERCRRLLDFGFPISRRAYRSRVNENVAPADRHRVEDCALLPGDRAPTQRAIEHSVVIVSRARCVGDARRVSKRSRFVRRIMPREGNESYDPAIESCAPDRGL
jgi:hypothetical protein